MNFHDELDLIPEYYGEFEQYEADLEALTLANEAGKLELDCRPDDKGLAAEEKVMVVVGVRMWCRGCTSEYVGGTMTAQTLGGRKMMLGYCATARWEGDGSAEEPVGFVAQDLIEHIVGDDTHV